MSDSDKRTQSVFRIFLATVVIGIGVWGLVTQAMPWWEITACIVLGSVVLLKKEV